MSQLAMENGSIKKENEINRIMENQATINIGTIGHVAHGKSTIVKCISGTNTIRYKSELERNITIKLGYANAKIFECRCDRPQRYSTIRGQCQNCHVEKTLIRHVSFVDCPGHDVLMATMLNGTAIMDAALLLIAANEPCPQSQTTEHLFAVNIMGLDKIIVVQNKIDLITKEQSYEQYKQIKDFLQTAKITAPIVPVSGQLNVNIDAILDYIVNYLEVPKRDPNESPRMIIIRSFDTNKPGIPYKSLSGGIIGGSIISGTIKKGDIIEIRPGIFTKTTNGFKCKPFITKVESLYAEKTPLECAVPGGLIGVGTNLDPNFCRSDKLIGMVMGHKDSLPSIYYRIRLNYELFEKTATISCQRITPDEKILLNISSTTTGCKILEIDEKTGYFELLKPCCVNIGERVSISRKVKNNWRLIGHGTLAGGETCEVEYDQ